MDAGLKFKIHYALKANSNQAIIKTLADLGAGGDVVSKGEIMRSMKAGIAGGDIVFSGVGKRGDEIEFALKAGVMQFNIESESELYLLASIAEKLQITADIALRVNPDVDAKTHKKISTGLKANKFGVAIVDAYDLYKKARDMPFINVAAVACHIGSQLTDLSPYRAAFEKVKELAEKMLNDGFSLSRIDLGGGLGVPYRPDNDVPPPPADYAKMVASTFASLKDRVSFMFEPGRVLVGNAGILLTKIIHIKHNGNKRFIIVDAAMNDLIRPTLYEGYHDIVPVLDERNFANKEKADIVGPVCESGDFLCQDRPLSCALKTSDLLAVRTAGAYGAVMAGTYNTRPLIQEILVNADDHALIRPPLLEQDIIAMDKMPAWLSDDDK